MTNGTGTVEEKIPRYINPVKELGSLLLDVEKPSRYSGGEYGRLADKNAPFQMLIAFPDLYEIGMSNQAFRILYNALNRIPGISCDRAFAPAPDFEQLLKNNKLPLYGLDTGIILKSLDVLMFTLGYELGCSGILCMMDVSGIPIHSIDRDESDPIVIAGGPAVSNPLPYSDFIDAFWIGEAEAGFFELAAELKELKNNGKDREALLKHIEEHPNIWVKGKLKARRAVYSGFGVGEKSDSQKAIQSTSITETAVFPVPSMKIVQHHGALEIMRGCPNGCRFCHAGFWYRPMRQKKQDIILGEAEDFINMGGYREISLSSLSSGDYEGIAGLVRDLNDRFESRHVSFQLPSLKVTGFSLSILEQITKTRKSGLTFAVETPVDAWQMSINKEVSRDSVVDILKEAKNHGYKSAKFYFMIGLPVGTVAEHEENSENEEEEIVKFIQYVSGKTGMHFNVTIGVFIPKPHTPFQWSAQLDTDAAVKKSLYIKTKLKSSGHHVSTPEPLISVIEGLISRGDERAGRFIEEAYTKGSRLDAWSEYIKKEIWNEIIGKNSDIINDFLSEKDPSNPLPWNVIDPGISEYYYKNEFEKSKLRETTSPCIKTCTDRCGVCNSNLEIVKNFIQDEAFYSGKNYMENDTKSVVPGSDPGIWRIVFSFSKLNSAIYQSHLGLIEIFSMALNRTDFPVHFTKGYNPLLKLEIASPLSLGISSLGEIAAIDFSEKIDIALFIETLNKRLPEGIRLNTAKCYCIPGGKKKHSLASLLWGFIYSGKENDEYIKVNDEKHYRESLGSSNFFLQRKSVLAKNITDNNLNTEWASYFDVYNYLYPSVF